MRARLCSATLAELGLAVTPLPAGGRLPEPGWQQRASTDPEHIRTTWPPAANIGVACRASGEHGLVVLDVDGDAGKRHLREMCQAAGARWPDTMMVRTPHGWHLYLWAPAGVVIPSTSGPRSPLGPGIDVRAPGRRRGGYVVGPGSVVGDDRYTIQLGRPIAPLPGWLVQHLTARGTVVGQHVTRSAANPASPAGVEPHLTCGTSTPGIPRRSDPQHGHLTS